MAHACATPQPSPAPPPPDKLACRFYAQTFPPAGNKDVAILDLCSSWISHYPEGYSAGRISGMCGCLCLWGWGGVGWGVGFGPTLLR
jgi:hypothetical protein